MTVAKVIYYGAPTLVGLLFWVLTVWAATHSVAITTVVGVLMAGLGCSFVYELCTAPEGYEE